MPSSQVLIVNGSPRRHGNTSWLINRVVDSFHQKGVGSKIVSAVALRSLNNGCTGCHGCQKSHDFLCVFKDDVQPLVASMPEYRCIIFATPVYFFGPTAQLKLVIDRMFSLIKSKNDKYVHPFSPTTKIGVIMATGGDENDGCDLVIDMFQRIGGILGIVPETLVMPLAPLTPEAIDDPDDWRRQAAAFCDKLLGK